MRVVAPDPPPHVVPLIPFDVILPLSTNLPQRGMPYVNGVVIVLTLVMHAVLLKTPELRSAMAFQPLAPEWWTLMSYAFVHADLLHLFGNMLFLWIFGNAINEKLGNVAYAGFYLGGAVFAGLAHMLFNINPVVGASGAVYAVTGLFVALAPQAKVSVLWVFILITRFEVSGLWFVAFFVAIDLILLGSGDNVARTAHLGGALFDFTVGMSLLGLRLMPRDLFDALALVDRWNRRRQFRSVTKRGYDAFGAKPELKATAADATPDEVHDKRAEISEALERDDAPAALAAYDALLKLDPKQVLAARQQVKVAAELKAVGRYGEAAAAYRGFLATYPRDVQADQVELLLGLLLARELDDPAAARPHLERAVDRLDDPQAVAIARDALRQATAGAGAGA